LKTSRYYNRRTAKDLCSRANPPMWAEVAYLAHLLGDMKEALRVLVVNAGDVRAAIDLARTSTVNDWSVWEHIVQMTVATGNGALVAELLDAAAPQGGDSGIFSRVLQQIPLGLHVPENEFLQRRLLRVLQDRRSYESMVSCCEKLVKEDVRAFTDRKAAEQRKGLCVKVGVCCFHCEEPLHRAPRSTAHPALDVGADTSAGAASCEACVILFFCGRGHFFHEMCHTEFLRKKQVDAAAAAGRSRTRRSSSVSSFQGGPRSLAAGGRRGSAVSGGGAFDALGDAAALNHSNNDDGSVSQRGALYCPVCTSSSILTL
jgi:hypothetical protein